MNIVVQKVLFSSGATAIALALAQRKEPRDSFCVNYRNMCRALLRDQ